MTGIYKITSPSGKIYVGQSKNIYNRWRHYYKLYDNIKNQVLLYRSLCKYSPELHKFEILERCSVNELSNRETYWQKHFDCCGLNGLNCHINDDSKCGDRRFVENVIPSTVIIDMNTGVYFYGSKDAAKAFNLNLGSLRQALHNPLRNKTSLIRLKNDKDKINKSSSFRIATRFSKNRKITFFSKLKAINVPSHFLGLIQSDFHLVLKKYMNIEGERYVDMDNSSHLGRLSRMIIERFKNTNIYYDHCVFIDDWNDGNIDTNKLCKLTIYVKNKY